MKSVNFIMAACMGILAACSQLNETGLDQTVPFDEGEPVKRVVFEAPIIRSLGEDGQTRASLNQEGDGNIHFGWAATDTVGIYPNQGSQVWFSLADGVGENIATFNGGGWSLVENTTYTCYFPFVGNIYQNWNAIPVSFTNQEQDGVSNYDDVRFFLASEGTTSSSGSLTFSFEVLNTVIRIKAIGLPAGQYSQLRLSTDESLFVERGTYSLANRTIVGTTTSNSLSLTLKNFTLTEASTDANPVLIYLASAPVNLSGKTVNVQIISSDGTVYKCEKTPSISYDAGAWGGLRCEMIEDSPETPIPEAIDLGLSVKWASCNLGANTQEGFGDYYAWGETEPYYISLDPLVWKPGKGCGYAFPAYKWCMGTEYTLTKYSGHSDYGYNGYEDNLVVLELDDDAAHANLGDKWRMPSDFEFNELISNCSWTWTTRNGIHGYLITSNKPGFTDNSIFLPAAGKWIGTNLSMSNQMGYYWKTRREAPFAWAWDLCIEEDGYSSMVESRCYGFSIRPVYGDPAVLVQSISLDQTELDIVVGESAALNATILPENATFKTLTWSSNNESAATVSSTGVVTGVAPGHAVIRATPYGTQSAVCYVTVYDSSIPVKGISLNKDNLTIVEGDTYALIATVMPSKATDKSVSWTSSNPSVATVSSTGEIVAQSAGSAIITVTTNDGGFTATCNVSVMPGSVTGVSLDKTTLSLGEGDTYALTATVIPSYALNKSVTWTSSNSSVATVSDSGEVVAQSAGNAIITATTNDGGFTATCNVSVIVPIESIIGTYIATDTYVNYDKEYWDTVNRGGVLVGENHSWHSGYTVSFVLEKSDNMILGDIMMTSFNENAVGFCNFENPIYGIFEPETGSILFYPDQSFASFIDDNGESVEIQFAVVGQFNQGIGFDLSMDRTTYTSRQCFCYEYYLTEQNNHVSPMIIFSPTNLPLELIKQ